MSTQDPDTPTLTRRQALKCLASWSGAAVVWTVVTTREHPPDDMKAFKRMRAEKAGILAGASEIVHDVPLLASS